MSKKGLMHKFFGIAMIAALLLILGAAGASDTNTITMTQLLQALACGIGALGLSIFGWQVTE